MIVKIGGWLFIVEAILGLVSVVLPRHPSFFSADSRVSGLVMGVLLGAVGVGLLKRLNWARWLALGITMTTWTLGSIGLVYLVVKVLPLIFHAGGLVAMLLAIFVFCLALAVVMIVINFKLFDYLITDEGKLEFDTPEWESYAILKSSGVYLALVAVVAMMDQSKFWLPKKAPDAIVAMQEHVASVAHADRQAREARDAKERENAAARIAAMRQNEIQQAEIDAANARVQAEAEARELKREYEERRAQLETRKPEANKILKCRDASGAISFTQAYCPAGTKRVETPSAD